MNNLILDPKGYFLIRIKGNQIEVGFCKYQDMVLNKSNKVLKQFSSSNTEEILNWIENNNLTTKANHLEYLKKELKRAKECMENNLEYIQE